MLVITGNFGQVFRENKIHIHITSRPAASVGSFCEGKDYVSHTSSEHIDR